MNEHLHARRLGANSPALQAFNERRRLCALAAIGLVAGILLLLGLLAPGEQPVGSVAAATQACQGGCTEGE